MESAPTTGAPRSGMLELTPAEPQGYGAARPDERPYLGSSPHQLVCRRT